MKKIYACLCLLIAYQSHTFASQDDLVDFAQARAYIEAVTQAERIHDFYLGVLQEDSRLQKTLWDVQKLFKGQYKHLMLIKFATEPEKKTEAARQVKAHLKDSVAIGKVLESIRDWLISVRDGEVPTYEQLVSQHPDLTGLAQDVVALKRKLSKMIAQMAIPIRLIALTQAQYKSKSPVRMCYLERFLLSGVPRDDREKHMVKAGYVRKEYKRPVLHTITYRSFPKEQPLPPSYPIGGGRLHDYLLAINEGYPYARLKGEYIKTFIQCIARHVRDANPESNNQRAKEMYRLVRLLVSQGLVAPGSDRQVLERILNQKSIFSTSVQVLILNGMIKMEVAGELTYSQILDRVANIVHPLLVDQMFGIQRIAEGRIYNFLIPSMPQASVRPALMSEAKDVVREALFHAAGILAGFFPDHPWCEKIDMDPARAVKIVLALKRQCERICRAGEIEPLAQYRDFLRTLRAHYGNVMHAAMVGNKVKSLGDLLELVREYAKGKNGEVKSLLGLQDYIIKLAKDRHELLMSRLTEIAGKNGISETKVLDHIAFRTDISELPFTDEEKLVLDGLSTDFFSIEGVVAKFALAQKRN